MNILLTGSSGFIGSYFSKKYSKNYNFNRFSFLKDDFQELDLKEIDVVVHLSALVHQMGGASKEEYTRVNVEQTLTLAKRAKESGVGHFVFMSSIKVYGEESDSVYKEQTTCHPKDDYGVSKLEAELELKKLEEKSFKISIIRTPIVYGYGVKANIKSLVSLVNKLPVLPFGAIDNRRSMVYIGNLCHLLDVIIQQKKEGLFLATDSEPLSTSRLIKLIAKALDKKVYLLNLPLFPSLLKILKSSFYKRLYGSLEVENSLTHELLSLKNPYTTEEGISFMIHGEKR